jgi:hypothetical protein
LTSTFAQSVLESLRAAAAFNPADEIAPIAVLWPDPTHTWRAVVSHLKRGGTTILTLGDFSERVSQGPALWIRSKLVSTDAGDELPIVYLPGVDRASMRALEGCPATLRPIAELQYRSGWWTTSADAEWTPASFLGSLGVLVEANEATREALGLALPELAAIPTDDLIARKYVDAEYFNELLVPDSVKSLIKWMDSEGESQVGAAWKAFVATCKQDFGIDPAKDGVLTAVARLGERKSKWAQVWDRFAEAPSAYPRILSRLRQARDTVLLAVYPDSWPQDNETAESALSSSLTAAAKLGTATEVRARIAELEIEHGERRNSIWAQLGQTRLADAIGHLAKLAELTQAPTLAGTVEDLRSWYVTEGSAVDDLVLSSVGSVAEGPHRIAVGAVVKATYRDWADANARKWQDLLSKEGTRSDTGLELGAGECALFVDGLRYDVAKRLTEVMSRGGIGVDLRSRLAPFPSMTSSGKPAVAPLASAPHGGSNFVPVLAGKTLDAPNLRAAMSQNGVGAFSETEYGDPTGKGWTEAADLDALGHKVDLKITDHLDGEIAEIAGRVQALLQHGWSRVHIVTDHGWLLMPGGLSVVKIDAAKTVVRKSRCAQLADHAGAIEQPEYPWTWDSSVRVAIPRGIAAFESGKIYDHGGVSPQETIVPHIIAGTAVSSSVRIEDITWKGMRCRVSGEGSTTGLTVDIRTKPADPGSSVAGPKPWSADGTALVVADDGLIGSSAYVVIINAAGSVIAQAVTTIPG